MILFILIHVVLIFFLTLIKCYLWEIWYFYSDYMSHDAAKYFFLDKHVFDFINNVTKNKY